MYVPGVTVLSRFVAGPSLALRTGTNNSELLRTVNRGDGYRVIQPSRVKLVF
jgi:hypothetical protein